MPGVIVRCWKASLDMREGHRDLIDKLRMQVHLHKAIVEQVKVARSHLRRMSSLGSRASSDWDEVLAHSPRRKYSWAAGTDGALSPHGRLHSCTHSMRSGQYLHVRKWCACNFAWHQKPTPQQRTSLYNLSAWQADRCGPIAAVQCPSTAHSSACT